MSSVLHLALNNSKAPLSQLNLVLFSQYSPQRNSIEIIRYARLLNDAKENRRDAPDVSSSHILYCALSSAGLFPSSTDRASSVRIQPGWRQVRVQCISCGAHIVIDRYLAIELWQQTSQILRSLHREDCQYANSLYSISGSSLSAEEGHAVESIEYKRDVTVFQPWLSADLGWSRLDFILGTIQPPSISPLPQLPSFIDLCLPEYLPSAAPVSATAGTHSARFVRECELLFFMSEHQQLARDRNVTRAQLLAVARVVQFDRDPPTSPVDREATAMREAEARLATFRDVATRPNGGAQVEMSELVALVVFGFYECESNGLLRVRCAFCRKAFPYPLQLPDAAARVHRLRLTHALVSHTCAMSLNHTADDRPLDDRHLLSLLSDSTTATPVAYGLGSSTVSLSLSGHPDPCVIPNVILADVTNVNVIQWSLAVPLDNAAYFEYSASTEMEFLADFESSPSQEIAEWSLPSVYQHRPSLGEALSGIAGSRHPDLWTTDSRLKTFSDYQWSSVNAHAPPADELVRAGFYCVKDSDSVRCWWCSVGLNQWDPGDRPLREHARYSPRCPLLLQLVGRRFVLGVLNERELTPDSRPTAESYMRDGVSLSLRLSAADEARIDPRAVRARLDWGPIALVRCDFDVPRPLLELVLKCFLARGMDVNDPQLFVEQLWECQNDMNARGIAEPSAYIALVAPNSQAPSLTSSLNPPSVPAAAQVGAPQASQPVLSSSSGPPPSSAVQTNAPNMQQSPESGQSLSTSNNLSSSHNSSSSSSSSIVQSRTYSGSSSFQSTPGTTSSNSNAFATRESSVVVSSISPVPRGVTNSSSSVISASNSGRSAVLTSTLAPSPPSFNTVSSAQSTQLPSSSDSALPSAPVALRGICRNCGQKESDCVLLPCGHLALCSTCAFLPTAALCPLCRAPVRSVVRTYLA